MATNASKLTVRVVEAVQPGTKDFILWDAEVKGFGLKVTPKGKKTFLLSYRTGDHVQRKPRIGDFPVMKPEAARAIALKWKAEVAAGGDPSAQRKAKRALRGKGTLSEMFVDYKRAKAALRSIEEIERLLNLIDRNIEVRALVEQTFSGFSRTERRRRLIDRCEADMFVCLKNIFASEAFDDIIFSLDLPRTLNDV